MNWDNIFNALGQPESFLSIILFIAAAILGMIFVWIWLGGRIKDARKELEEEQLKNSALMGKNEELENEAKVHLAEVNRIKINYREAIAQNETLIQDKDQLYSKVIMLSESEAILKDELEDVSSRYAIMEASFQKMSSSVNQVSNDFETSVAQKDGLHSRVTELEAQNEELLGTRTRENASYVAQLNALQETINHLEAEHTVTKNELTSKTESFDNFRTKYLTLKTENSALVSSNESLSSDLERAKEGVIGFSATESNSKDKEIAAVYNAQILTLQDALEVATNNLATLEAEKAMTNEKLQTQENEAEVSSDNANPSYSSFSDDGATSLAVELNVVKKQLAAEHQNRIEQQQEADKWRASLITLKANLGQAEEDKAREQEHFLNEFAELKASHKAAIELENQKLSEAQTKIEDLETKITWLEATNSDSDHDMPHLKTSQSNTLDVENDKLATATDENANLQSQVDSLLSRIRELQSSTDEVGLMGDTVQDELIDGLETEAMQLEATADDASNDMMTLEAKHAEVIAASKEQIDSLNLQIDRAEAKVVNLEAALNETENEIVELEEKYTNILNVENDKFAAAKDNILSLETQVSLLEAKTIRAEAAANDAENDYIEYEAKFERLIDLEQVKLSAVKDENMSLMEQVAELKMKSASSIPVESPTNQPKKPATQVIEKEIGIRADANLGGNEMDSYQAIKTLKKLVGSEIPFAMSQNDDLKVINGIGPRIEEALNELGINSYRQISTLTKTHTEIIRTALDIFPGRIERDNWVRQAKKLYKNNDELTPETARIAFEALIGNKIPMATPNAKDDLKLIKGVGGFLEKKLNNIGIYTFKQISKFDKDAIEKITIAIEFFPGRIKRDKWVKQAKELM